MGLFSKNPVPRELVLKTGDVAIVGRAQAHHYHAKDHRVRTASIKNFTHIIHQGVESCWTLRAGDGKNTAFVHFPVRDDMAFHFYGYGGIAFLYPRGLIAFAAEMDPEAFLENAHALPDEVVAEANQLIDYYLDFIFDYLDARKIDHFEMNGGILYDQTIDPNAGIFSYAGSEDALTDRPSFSTTIERVSYLLGCLLAKRVQEKGYQLVVGQDVLGGFRRDQFYNLDGSYAGAKYPDKPIYDDVLAETAREQFRQLCESPAIES